MVATHFLSPSLVFPVFGERRLPECIKYFLLCAFGRHFEAAWKNGAGWKMVLKVGGA